MSTRDNPVVQAYIAQYSGLPDEELRSIVRGNVPWVDSGKYTYAARCAAHLVLKDRSAANIPRLPWFDPEQNSLPSKIRLRLVIGTVVAMVSIVVAWVLLHPMEPADDSEVCEQARSQLRSTEFAFQFELALPDCQVDYSAQRTVGNTVHTPITFRACISLSERHLPQLRTASPRRIAILRRFASTPSPGQHCANDGIVLARLLQAPSRPWDIKLALLDTE
ncbi:MAG: hypothetical protein VX223_15025 [Myxococcota bacterium]|nr:hypothetical protein [Myxococcota bacterium]